MNTKEMLDIVSGIEFHKKAVLFHTQLLSTLEETLKKNFKIKREFEEMEEALEGAGESNIEERLRKKKATKGKRVKCIVCSRNFNQSLAAIKRGAKAICSPKCTGKRMGLIKAGRWDKIAEKEIHEITMQ